MKSKEEPAEIIYRIEQTMRLIQADLELLKKQLNLTKTSSDKEKQYEAQIEQFRKHRRKVMFKKK